MAAAGSGCQWAPGSSGLSSEWGEGGESVRAEIVSERWGMKGRGGGISSSAKQYQRNAIFFLRMVGLWILEKPAESRS